MCEITSVSVIVLNWTRIMTHHLYSCSQVPGHSLKCVDESFGTFNSELGIERKYSRVYQFSHQFVAV